MYKVCILGYGLSGRVFHAPFVDACDSLTLSSFFSSKEVEITKRYKGCVVYSDWKTAIDSDCDIIINTLPNDLHYEVTKYALLKNKHVVVEKPFVTNLDEGRELIDLAKSKNLTLSVYHNRRWDSDFLTLKKLLNNKELGIISHFESHFSRYKPNTTPGKWREDKDYPGSGVLYDLGSHLIDQAIQLFGLPEKVFCDLQYLRNSSDDYFHIIFYYNNLRVILHSTVMASDHSLRMLVHGSKKTFKRIGIDSQENSLKKEIPLDDKTFAPEYKDDFLLIDSNIDSIEYVDPVKGNYLSFYNELVKEIKKEDNEYVAPESALEVIKLIQVCIKSHIEEKIIRI